jgi:hypothetical protein
VWVPLPERGHVGEMERQKGEVVAWLAVWEGVSGQEFTCRIQRNVGPRHTHRLRVEKASWYDSTGVIPVVTTGSTRSAQ